MQNLQVLDTDLNMVGYIDQYVSLIWTDRYDQYGDFELVVPITDYNKEVLKINYILINNKSEHFMFIEEIDYTDSDDGEVTMKLSGRSGESILDRRIVWKKQSWSSSTKLPVIVADLLRNNIIWPECFETGTYRRQIPNFVFHGAKDMIRSSWNEYVFGNASYTWQKCTDNTDYYIIDQYISVVDGVSFWLQLTCPNQYTTWQVREYDSSKNLIRTVTQQAYQHESFSWLYTPTSGSTYVRFMVPAGEFEYYDPNVCWFQSSGEQYNLSATVEACSYEGDNLYTVIKDLCTANHVGFKVVLKWNSVWNTYRYCFELYEGWDRTFLNGHRPHVIFSKDYNNMTKTEWSEDYKLYYNSILTIGQDPDETMTNNGRVKQYAALRSSVDDDSTMYYRSHDGTNNSVTGTCGKFDGLYRRETVDDSSSSTTHNVTLTSTQVSTIQSKLTDTSKSTEDIAKEMGWTEIDTSQTTSSTTVYKGSSFGSAAVSRVKDGEKDANGNYYIETYYTADEYYNVLVTSGKKSYHNMTGYLDMTCETMQSASFTYQTDFWVGDRVTYVDAFKNRRDGRITEWIYSDDASKGVREYPTIELDTVNLTDELKT